VNIGQLDHGGQLGFFGGQAPMGAGQDDSGSKLHAGIRDGKLMFGFFGRDISGQTAVPLGQWVHVAYVYDAAANQGSLYLGGKLDVQKGQKPYEGALETIGTTPVEKNGQFALHDVTVICGALNQASIEALMDKGPTALKSGKYQTQWRPAVGPLTDLRAWAEVPSGSRSLR